MLLPSQVAELQRSQYAHDMRNHFDILSLHKADRLKHYGLHFAKYVGRLARESSEPIPVERTVLDAVLVSLSAANTLHQDLSKENLTPVGLQKQVDPLRPLADAAGRFADACEKIDHLEDFVPIARTANRDMMSWLVLAAEKRKLDLVGEITKRRKELEARHFYIP
jgi:hypothetical protein